VDGDCPVGMLCTQVSTSTLYICYPEQV